jgi:hypothetical protein
MLVLAAACAVSACSDSGTSTLAAPASALAEAGAGRISVLSRNLYIGADLAPAIAALASPSTADDIPAIINTVNTIKASEWPALALTDEIARNRPHVVGLQEIWTVNVNLGLIGIPVSLDHEFLADLMAALQARGLPYVVVAQVKSITASVPPLVSVTDRDVLLVDPTRVTVDPASIAQNTFAANLGAVAPDIALLRGWVTVDAVVEGETVRIASTHLESGQQPGLAQLRALQVKQFVASLGTVSPAIILGEPNDVEGSPMYEAGTAAGFRDTWREMPPGVVGLTCCHADDLTNATTGEEFDQRIDHVFARGMAFRNDQLLGQVDLPGVRPSEPTVGQGGDRLAVGPRGRAGGIPATAPTLSADAGSTP